MDQTTQAGAQLAATETAKAMVFTKPLGENTTWETWEAPRLILTKKHQSIDTFGLRCGDMVMVFPMGL